MCLVAALLASHDHSHFETSKGRGGFVRGIVYRRIHGVNVGGAAIQINTGYSDGPILPNATNTSGTPILENLLFEDCTFVVGDLGYAANLMGLAERPVANVTWRNVSFVAGAASSRRSSSTNPSVPGPARPPVPGKKGWGKCENVVGVCTGGTPLASCPPCFSFRD